MKRKMIYLMLPLFILSVASVKSQVQIGGVSTDDPQSGAVLDLSQVNSRNLGFLLPRVSLSNLTEWQLQGSATNGTGMLVYNTHTSTTNGDIKAGVYIWNGANWEPLKSNLSEGVPVSDFDLQPSDESTVVISVGEEVSFTAFNFMPSNASYPGVTWSITSGTDKAVINKSTQSMTRCTVTGLAIGTATLTVTGLDGEVGKTVTISVAACTSAPAAPTGITFSQTTKIKLTEEITATATPEVTSGNAKPTKYNWTIPGAYFEIVSGAGTRIIRLKAKAGASSITGTITVNAENSCGTSADYSNTTPLNILACSVAPATPDEIQFSTNTVELNGTFTASVSVVTGATSYEWNLPDGLTIANGSGTHSITITGAKAGNYAAGAIKVTATNACGTSAAQSSASAVTVVYATVTGSRGTYRTYCYPNGVGCWTIDNSKEGTYSATTYEDQSAGARGYYYSWANAMRKSGGQYTACPTGYSVPTESQWTALMNYIEGSATSAEKAHWTSGVALAGDYSVGADAWMSWDSAGYWWSSSVNEQIFFASTGMDGPFTYTFTYYRSVRCVKN